MYRHILPIILASGISISMAAQNHLDASVNVDGKYLPDIIRMERINKFPAAATTAIQFSGLNYSLSGEIADFNPDSRPMTATLWGASHAGTLSRGYLDLSLGSWLTSDLSAGYRIINTGSTSLSTRLQFNSTSLWKDKEMPEYRSLGDSETRERYDGVVGFDLTHKFGSSKWLDSDIQYHLGAFNYYGLGESQTLNDLAVRAGWHDNGGAGCLNWNVNASARYFAYRSGGYWDARGTRETRLTVAGDLSMPWSSGSTLSLDARADMYFYGGSILSPDNYGIVTFTPGYTFSRGKTFIRVGADVDLSVNAGEEGDRYAFFHIAPDCRLMTDFGRVGLSLDVTGGTEAGSLASLYALDYYQSPVLFSSRPVYTPADARLSLTFGPFSGFTLTAWGEYKISRGIFLGGGYLDRLYGNRFFEYGRMNLHGFSVGAKINWLPSKVIGVEAYASFQPQRGENGFFNGYDRPRGIAGASVDVHPLDRLRLNVNYELRTHRRFYCPSLVELPNLSLLGAEVSFDITDRLALGVEGANLLNRRNVMLPGNPSEGLTVLGNLRLFF